MTSIADRLAWLGGADLEVLAKAPRDRDKFAQMGCVLLTTSGIATLSMTFAVHNTMSVPVPIALFFGILWGLVILNLDRFLVVSMGSIRDWKRLLAMAVPRLLLAIVVSAVISTPVTLEIFRGDIYATMTQMNLQESQRIAKQEANSDLQTRLASVSKQIAADQAILNGQLPAAVTSPQAATAQAQVSKLTPEVAEAKSQEIQAYEVWQCELYGDGCANGSGKVGEGPIAQAKEATYEQDKATYDSLNAQLQQAAGNLATAQKALGQSASSRLAAYQKAASAQLPGLKSQQAQLATEIRQQDNYDQGTAAGDTGLLRQLQALFTASSGNSVLLIAHLTVTALFFLIELLPVAVKLLLNLGQPTCYEVALTAEEKSARRRLERESDEEEQVADALVKARIDQALDMSSRQAGLGLRANEHVVAKMEEILDAALAQWSSQVQAKLGSVPREGPLEAVSALPTGNGHHQLPGVGLADPGDAL